jgi:hypothetical protein
VITLTAGHSAPTISSLCGSDRGIKDEKEEEEEDGRMEEKVCVCGNGGRTEVLRRFAWNYLIGKRITAVIRASRICQSPIIQLYSIERG